MIRDYAVNQHNSTVCGYPGRDYDWSKFDWTRETFHETRLGRGGITFQHFAPGVLIDGVSFSYEYLHVPYAWSEDATIYRVRPNESMRAGHVYRGHLVTKCEAVQKDDGWYWRLHSPVHDSRGMMSGR